MNPDRNIRRLQSRLYTSGLGIILFSLWSVIRETGMLFESLKDIHDIKVENIDPRTFYVICGLLIVGVIFGTAFLYIYIGRRAMQTSLGKCNSNAYLVWAILIIVVSAISYVSDIIHASVTQTVQARGVVLFVIDFTSNLILVELVVSSVLLKRRGTEKERTDV